MRKVLVTGGFGFLGSHLLELLLSDPNVTVHVVDNLSTSPLPLEHLLQELGHPHNLTYTITSVDEFCRNWTGEHYDQIYHLASVVGPAGVIPHAGRLALSILNDTLAVARIALACKARLVDVSTSEVYGGGRDGYCSESMPKIISSTPSPRLEYAVGKLAAEIAILNLCKSRQLDARIVRPFNIAGPRQSGKGGFVLPRFIGQALAGYDITIFGNGSQVRAFTYVKDIVRGIQCVMEKGKAGEVYNLGNPENRCTILQLAQEVQTITGTKAGIVFVDPKTIFGPFYEEANDKFPDATKAYNELGWRPSVRREEIIASTYQYMRSLPEPLLMRLRGF